MCRYSNCLQHHISTDIVRDDPGVCVFVCVYVFVRMWGSISLVIKKLPAAGYGQVVIVVPLSKKLYPMHKGVCYFLVMYMCSLTIVLWIIFITLEFKGYVSLCCTERCVVAFHSLCWRRLREDSVDHQNDKVCSTSL